MKRVLVPFLAAAVMFLLSAVFLNWRHGGPDEFPGGSLAPPPVDDPTKDNELARLLPSELTHACPTCGDCVHPVEIVESARTLRMRDHHHWFQLFKSADRFYYFGDLIALASCMNVRSARDPWGEWKISARVGPARHPKGAAHDCGQVPSTLSMTYELVVSAESIPDAPAAFAAPFPIAGSAQMLVFQYGKPPETSTLNFGWRIAAGAPPGTAPRVPCDCGKP